MPLLPYAPVILKLLQGVMYSDDPHWDRLQSYLPAITEYFGKIGLKVRNYEADGFAYLEQPDADAEEGTESLPRLTVRRPLDLKLTIFCVLLREELRLFDVSDATGKLVLSIEKIRELLYSYYPEEENNQESYRKKVNILVNKAIDLGFLKKLKPEDESYEVRRILKAKIHADTLNLMKQKLENLCKNP